MDVVKVGLRFRYGIAQVEGEQLNTKGREAHGVIEYSSSGRLILERVRIRERDGFLIARADAAGNLHSTSLLQVSGTINQLGQYDIKSEHVMRDLAIDYTYQFDLPEDSPAARLGGVGTTAAVA